MIFDKPSAKKFETVRVEGFDDPVDDVAEIGKVLYRRIGDSDRVEVLRHSGTKASVAIPDSISVAKCTFAVSEIGASAFEGCSGLAGITLPDSLESIGEGAFSGCSGLTDIAIPGEVRSIGERAFAGCAGLRKVVMKGSPETIAASAFDGCSSLKAFEVQKSGGRHMSDSRGLLYSGEMETLVRVPCGLDGTADIPSGVVEIGERACSGCSSMTTVRIPASVRRIRDDVFSGCVRLALLYVDPRNTHYRSDLQGVLYDSKVTEVIRAPTGIVGALEIPNTVVRVCPYAFEGCNGLVSISIPFNTVEIGDSAFEGCTRVRSISMAGSVVRIGDSAFRNCSGIVSVSIPDSVETIGDRAFFGCSRLNSVSIPVEARIGEQAFPANSDIVME